MFEKIIGMGQEEQMDRINKKLVLGLYRINGFLDLLLVNGILGLTLFVVFLRKIIMSYNFYKTEYNSLVQSLFMLYLTMCFFQGYNWINMNYKLVYYCYFL